MEMDDAEKLKKLRGLVRKFLREIEGVPMRAVDCDQEKVNRLWEQLADASGFRRDNS